MIGKGWHLRPKQKEGEEKSILLHSVQFSISLDFENIIKKTGGVGGKMGLNVIEKNTMKFKLKKTCF